MMVSRVSVLRGPSPRERGAPEPLAGLGAGEGTIPARAGSTVRASESSARSRDHPRASGEHAVSAAAVTRSMGPSPRERGAPGQSGGGAEQLRTIPARAGSTGDSAGSTTASWDHPRASGEHLEIGLGHDATTGPSPRERGAQRGHYPQRHRLGTIPARAGSTRIQHHQWCGDQDHPRASGEHDGVTMHALRHRGPSPRERGAPPFPVFSRPFLGTIPARAGSTP